MSPLCYAVKHITIQWITQQYNTDKHIRIDKTYSNATTCCYLFKWLLIFPHKVYMSYTQKYKTQTRKNLDPHQDLNPGHLVQRQPCYLVEKVAHTIYKKYDYWRTCRQVQQFQEPFFHNIQYLPIVPTYRVFTFNVSHRKITCKNGLLDSTCQYIRKQNKTGNLIFLPRIQLLVV